MDELSNLMNVVESDEFDVRFGVISSYDGFIRHIKESYEFTKLVNLMLTDRWTRSIIRNRIFEIFNKSIDKEFENSLDTSICVYLLVLEETGQDITMELNVIDKIPNLHWARKLGGELKKSENTEFKN